MEGGEEEYPWLSYDFHTQALAHAYLPAFTHMNMYVYMHCGGLNDSGPHRIIYFNAWSLVGAAVWGGSEGVILLEKVCH